MKLARPSAVALVLANLVPLAGVVWLDWRVFDVLLLYWAENVVIGIVNVLRMGAIKDKGRLFLIPFFTFHYGMFCIGHYTAVISLFSANSAAAGFGGQGFFGVPLAEVWRTPLWLGVAAVAASHLLSFYFNFIRDGEHRRTDLSQLMRRPYGRIVALHIAVIAGGFLVTTLGDPTWMLLVLIVIKSAMDLGLHERERRLFAVAPVSG